MKDLNAIKLMTLFISTLLFSISSFADGGNCPEYSIEGNTISVSAFMSGEMRDGHVEFQSECQIEGNGMNFQFNWEFNGEQGEESNDEGSCPIAISKNGSSYMVATSFVGTIDEEGRVELQQECQKNGSGLRYESNLELNLEIE